MPKRVHSTAGKDLVFEQGTQDPTQALTERQRMFVHHLVHDKLTQTAAARAAGFGGPGTAATTLMKNPKVIAAIAAERLEYAQASGMTRKKVIDGFAEAIDMARLLSDPTAMISGWREIGKMCGLYEAQKTEVKVSVNGQVMLHRLNSMSDEELLQLAETQPEVLDGEFNVVDE